mmetsp:Transcript_32150/g.78322  ORF Transcript_32150/g.78322 Transcript_32150/m.78322 type:complete len:215 (-) Transcript_32150:1981-2625(-)
MLMILDEAGFEKFLCSGSCQSACFSLSLWCTKRLRNLIAVTGRRIVSRPCLKLNSTFDLVCLASGVDTFFGSSSATPDASLIILYDERNGCKRALLFSSMRCNSKLRAAGLGFIWFGSETRSALSTNTSNASDRLPAVILSLPLEPRPRSPSLTSPLAPVFAVSSLSFPLIVFGICFEGAARPKSFFALSLDNESDLASSVLLILPTKIAKNDV